MAAGPIHHAPGIELAGDVLADTVPIEHFMIVHPVPPPQRLLRFQRAHVLRRIGGVNVAVPEVAVDTVSIHQAVDDPGAFLQKPTDEGARFRPVPPLDNVQPGVETVHHLPAIAARRAPSDTGALDKDDVIAFFSEVDCRGQAGIAGADHADIRDLPASQNHRIPGGIGRRRVIAAGIGAIPRIGGSHAGRHMISR